jgi:hypothetical protein
MTSLVETPRRLIVALAENNLNWDLPAFAHRLRLDPKDRKTERLWLAFVRAAADLAELADLDDAGFAVVFGPEFEA